MYMYQQLQFSQDTDFIYNIGEGDERGGDLFPAHQAAAAGDLDTLTAVIKADPTVLEMYDNEGR